MYQSDTTQGNAGQKSNYLPSFRSNIFSPLTKTNFLAVNKEGKGCGNGNCFSVHKIYLKEDYKRKYPYLGSHSGLGYIKKTSKPTHTCKHYTHVKE